MQSWKRQNMSVDQIDQNLEQFSTLLQKLELNSDNYSKTTLNLAESIKKIFTADIAAIWLVNTHQASTQSWQDLSLQALATYLPESAQISQHLQQLQLAKILPALDQPKISATLLTDVEASPDTLHWWQATGLSHSALVPLKNDRQTLGLVTLFSRQPLTATTLLPLIVNALANSISKCSSIATTIDTTSPTQEQISERLSTVIEDIPIGILIVDMAELRLSEINRMALRQLNLMARRNWRGSQLAELLPEPLSEILPVQITAICSTREGITINEHEQYWRGRGVVYWRIDAQPLFNGGDNISEILISLIDISEVVIARRRIEQMVNEAKERVTELEAIIAQMAEGVIVVDSLARVLSINPRGQELLDTNVVGTELPNQAHTYHLYGMDGEMLNDEVLPFVRAVQHGEIVKDFEIIVRPPNGSERVISVNAAPLFNSENQIIGAVAAFHDITDRIRYQQVLEQKNEQLREVDRLKTRFISTVSHELRTPLNAITGLAQLLQRDKSEPLSERQRDMVNRIALNSRQLMLLINDLLDYSRLASGKERVNLKRFSVSELIEKVWAGLIDTAIDKGLECFKEVGELGEIESDYTKCHQVLTNLLGNAIKYTQQGRIWLRVFPIDAEFWSVEVEDTGPGISNEDVGEIFDEFHRSRNAEMGKVTGTGLGLPISRKMVELMGGGIEAESVVGHGSIFRVRWPREVSKYIDNDLIAGYSQS